MYSKCYKIYYIDLNIERNYTKYSKIMWKYYKIKKIPEIILRNGLFVD